MIAVEEGGTCPFCNQAITPEAIYIWAYCCRGMWEVIA